VCDLDAAPTWLERAVIGEIDLRKFSENGAISDLTTNAQHLKALGINILVLKPFFPRGKTYELIDTGQCQSILDYQAVDPEIGNIEGFKRLVTTLHKHNIRIIMDWPLNRAGFDNIWINLHQGWFKRTDANRFVKREGVKQSCLATFDYYNNAMRRAMIEALEFWVVTCGVDGFRFDFDKNVSTSFWKELHSNFYKKNSPIALMGLNSEMESYDSKYFHVLEGGNLLDVFKALSRKAKDGSPIMIRPGREENIMTTNGLYYISSSGMKSLVYDEYSEVVSHVLSQNLIVSTFMGVPLFEDEILQIILEQEKTDGVGNLAFKSILRLKKENLALINDPYLKNTSVIESNDEFLHFKREVGASRVDVIVNLSDKSYEHEFSAEYKGKNYLTGLREHWYPQANVILEPYGFRIMVNN
jgi:glycosidase